MIASIILNIFVLNTRARCRQRPKWEKDYSPDGLRRIFQCFCADGYIINDTGRVVIAPGQKACYRIVPSKRL
jgi:hypothetical protein